MRLTGHVTLLAACALLGTVSASPQEPDRNAPPRLGPPPLLTLPPVQRAVLGNGLPVMLMEKHSVPLVQITLLVRAGAVDDPGGKEGLASMTAAMMAEGAGPRDALQLADAVDFLGAELGADAGDHTSSVSLLTPLSRLDSALALMADVVLRPLFPPAELERRRVALLTTLLQWREEPEEIAPVAFNRALYGAVHPYGRPRVGHDRSIRSFTPADLASFHGTFFRPNNATMIVVGDVSAAAILPRLEAAFGGWKPGHVPRAALPPTGQVSGREIILVDKPGAAQTVVRIGRVGVPRLTDDYFALIVANTILGGSFGSRLYQNLRARHRYTYGAWSQFSLRLLAGPFFASAAVQTAVTDSALWQFMRELREIREPVSPAELERAKNYVALAYPGNFQSVAQIAAQLEELATYGLPDDYCNGFTGRILAVTGADVARVARACIDPENIAIVLVGDRVKIEAGVKGLNLGPLRIRTVDDVLGKAPVIRGR